MYELSVKTRFSAAHRLRDYQGACAMVHGHNWDVEVFVRGAELDEAGLLVDFRVLKDAVRASLEQLDHADLNTIEWFREHNPTSECIARYLFERLEAGLDAARCRVHRVAVSETPESRAVYWKQGRDD
jgi:6-pyruvoyltetrahydropterin/6-carboxytetrahydropterin synthase